METDLEGFEDFWRVYPRHVGKLDAQKAYRQAIKMVSSATIVNAARKYAFECIGKDMQYVKLPAGWLRAGRWGDILSYTVDKPEDELSEMFRAHNFRPLSEQEMQLRDEHWLKTRGFHAPRNRDGNWWVPKDSGWWFPSAQPPQVNA